MKKKLSTKRGNAFTIVEKIQLYNKAVKCFQQCHTAIYKRSKRPHLFNSIYLISFTGTLYAYAHAHLLQIHNTLMVIITLFVCTQFFIPLLDSCSFVSTLPLYPTQYKCYHIVFSLSTDGFVGVLFVSRLYIRVCFKKGVTFMQKRCKIMNLERFMGGTLLMGEVINHFIITYINRCRKEYQFRLHHQIICIIKTISQLYIHELTL